MSEDLETLLRSGLAQVAEAAPDYDDPGLADAAIAGAGRIRRRRRVGAAAGGTGLLVLGAAAFVWQPWTAPVSPDEGVIAGDTSTSQAQTEFDLEFAVLDTTGGYEVLTEDDERLAIGEELPENVYGMTDSYLVETADAATVYAGDGSVSDPYAMSYDAYVKVNTGGGEFAIVTPTTDFTSEEYRLADVLVEGGEAPRTFTTSFDITLTDWSDSTAVFTAELWSSTAGETSSAFMFNDSLDLGLETVAQAGFQSVVLTDQSDPNYVCVADLDPEAGTSSDKESCGYADDQELQAGLVDAADDPDSPELMAQAVGRASNSFDGDTLMNTDAAYEAADAEGFYEYEGQWSDPKGRWQIAGNPGDASWKLLDLEGEEPVITELAIPSGAVLPVLDYA
ncbi:hypothetical protein [Glycomyces paridis]|uniref:Uncharacterized protein n=1 Tax=Glycomyces paridis TaxID=2126555 RepID=A0A4V4HQ16_9ACTN|nr:hypothetical protein [Glycomyces paridis]THV32016.1 hypothetical protein E9998_00740 [Glycomyces paridis]